MDVLAGIIVGIVVGAVFSLLFTAVYISDNNPVRVEVRSAIEQCEESLPRDQSCEHVITARLKEIGNE